MGVSTENCVTLSDIAANNSKYFRSNNIEIWFLPGVHYITSQTDTWIGVTKNWVTAYSRFTAFNISLIGKTNMTVHNCSFGSVTINCNGTNVGFGFKRVFNLTISGIEIVHCGANVTKLSRYPPLQASVFTSLFLLHVKNIVLWDVTIEHSIGFGLLALDLTDDVTVDKCTFCYNHATTHNLNGTEVYLPGGNVYIEVTGISTNMYSFTKSNLIISKSVFAHGSVKRKNPLFSYDLCNNLVYAEQSPRCNSQSAGLSLDLENMRGNITISNCTFTNNTAPYGANMLVTMTGRAIINVSSSIFSEGKSTHSGSGVYIDYTDSDKFSTIIFSNSVFKSNAARHFGGGLFIKADCSYYWGISLITIEKCTFIKNQATLGGAVYTDIVSADHDYPSAFTVTRSMFKANQASKYGGAILSTYDKQLKKQITYQYRIQHSIFVGNIAEWGSAVSLYYLQKSQEEQNPIEIANCTFIQHEAHKLGSGSVIHLNEVESIFFTTTRIANNMCRGIHVNMSSIKVGRNVWITNNTAKQGAGIFFDCYPPSLSLAVMSYMLLNMNSSLYIQDNHAERYGGGIMFESGCNDLEICFFQVPKHFNSSEGMAVQISGNTADTAGTSIYGGSLENCFMKANNAPLMSSLFWSTFNITERNLGPSVVASQPYKVCICNQSFTTDHSCSFDYSIEVYPGQTFHVPAVGVGQYNYSSPSVIRATVVNGYNAQLGEQQVTQYVNLLCKNLTYSLQTLETSVVIRLSIETPFSSETVLPELQPATLTVTILDCPLGFELYKDTQTCDCLPHLANRGVTCNILDQTVHRSRTMWIGNFEGDIVVHHNCPFDYCDQNVTDFSLDNQEEQCDLNRTGILCGACKSGYRLVLGTSKCKKCSNVYLLLLLPILLSGFGLVVLLLKCNLTVSTGTINGLIFYANIIQVNNKVFFPPGSISVPGYILAIFIAWINLDLGIEVCFTESLSTFARTWLQFLFPIYIWLIVGLLILVCRYSTTVSRLTGSNTVQVLATLFLLSYAKLLRTTLNAFSPITITDRNNTEHLRWLLDGNYSFLHWPHLALFLAGLLTLVAHLIPFTALVLLGPTLQAHTDYRVLGWVTRFKPFLDAYQGPYKTKYRYWTGLMLLVRVFLFAVFAGNALGDPNVNLLTISLTILVLLIAWVKIGRAYRMSPLNGLELFYLVNLGITATATLYLRATSDTNTQQQVLSLIMVGSALIVFISTLIYHCYSELIKTNRGKKLKRKAQAIWSSRQHRANNEEIIGQDEGESQPQVKARSPTRTVVCLEELKEPLLED